MKKILVMTLAAVLLMSLAAMPASAELSGTIRYSTWGSVAEKEINEAIIAAFEEENPGCKVELEYIPDQYTQKIDTMFLGGEAPDVIYGHPHYFAGWAANGLLMNLNDMFEQEKDFFYGPDFTTSMYDMFKYKGDHVGTINGHDSFLLFYNKTLFDEAGVAYPTEDWTWDDFVAAGQKLTKETESGKQYACTFDEYNLNAILYSFGGDLYDDMNNPTKVVADSPDTVAALQFIQDCISKYGIAPDTKDLKQVGGSFQTGKIAMEITGAWAVATNARIEDFEWDCAMVPLREGYPRRVSAYYAGYAVNAATQNPELAKAFAKYFQSDRAQKLLCEMGLITVINNNIASSEPALKGPGAPEHAYYRVTTAPLATNGYAMLTNREETMIKVISPAIERLLAGTTTAEQCSKDMQDGLTELLPAGIG